LDPRAIDPCESKVNLALNTSYVADGIRTIVLTQSSSLNYQNL